MVIVSPHLDDAVFACGQTMAETPGCTVLTVFAGFPSEDAPLPDWDARCGFHSPHEALLARREEDRRALAMLSARPLWLEFLDSQYGHTPTVEAVSEAIVDVLSDLDPDTVLLPLGLFHSDHILVHQAGWLAVQSLPGVTSVRLYEDVPYRGIEGLVQERLDELADKGMVVTPGVTLPVAGDRRKARAVSTYSSQLRALGEKAKSQLEMPEKQWCLHRPTAPLAHRLPASEASRGE